MKATEWPVVYGHIVSALRKIYRQYKDDAGKYLYGTLKGNDQLNPWLSKYKERNVLEIDPIALFASISDRRTSKNRRNERIDFILNRLEIPFEFRDVDISGCPTPVALAIATGRKPDQQREIWSCFNEITEIGKKGLLKEHFDQFKHWQGVDLASFTIFLFWVKPHDFLPLDRNTVSYLRAKNYMSGNVKKYEDYLKLLNETDIKDYLHFSKTAYREVKEDARKRSPFNSSITPNLVAPEDYTAEIPPRFKIVGIRVYEQTAVQLRKVLSVDKPYEFFESFSFSEGDQIEFKPNVELSIYDQGLLNVSVTAIVGKNGTGKSSLIELLYAGINNITKLSEKIETDIELIDDVHLDLFYFTEHLYKIELKGYWFRIWEYTFDEKDSRFKNPIELSVNTIQFDDFFYGISINYSLYSLNPNRMGEWINNLFDKNDAYQVPLVINPHRTNGNIDVNKEQYLAHSRLISNILQNTDPLKDGDSKNTLRKLTDNKSAEKIQLKIDYEKVNTFYSRRIKQRDGKFRQKVYYFEKAQQYWVEFARTLEEVFELPSKSIPKSINGTIDVEIYAYKYLLKKAASISLTYNKYKGEFKASSGSFKNIKRYLTRLKNEYSHITYKFWQTVHFIKYNHIREWIPKDYRSDKSFYISIDVLADNISILLDNLDDERIRTIHFIPPPIFQTQIFLEGGVLLDDLSSGEKQRIYAASTLAYHLMNLDSKMSTDGSIAYRFVQVFFDEVELYFHPEMQREFVYYILNYINYLQLDQLTAVNLMFVTHSPFILSDIPASQTLFLEEEDKSTKTFGANIHDLLATGFFLKEGYMGKFAKGVIVDLMEGLTGSNERWDRSNSKILIDSIGEPLIRERLWELYKMKFGAKTVREQIDYHQKELERLQNAQN